MHVEVVEHKRVLSNFSWGPRAKISENLIDQWCEQGDIHPSILCKLVPLSSICSHTHNENLGDKNVPTILRPNFLAPHLFRPQKMVLPTMTTPPFLYLSTREELVTVLGCKDAALDVVSLCTPEKPCKTACCDYPAADHNYNKCLSYLSHYDLMSHSPTHTSIHDVTAKYPKPANPWRLSICNLFSRNTSHSHDNLRRVSKSPLLHPFTRRRSGTLDWRVTKATSADSSRLIHTILAHSSTSLSFNLSSP
jgi:hypothetical protein